jgi:hypothetical protein
MFRGVKHISLLLAMLVITSICTASEMPSHEWQYQIFDGQDFHEVNSPEPRTIALRDGYLPVVSTDKYPLREDRLPKGLGALAIYGYLQGGGGKLQSRSLVPLGGSVVEISGKDARIAGRTDDAGYLVLAVPPGQYEVRLATFTRKVRVDKGKCSLVAIRGGKRMVD